MTPAQEVAFFALFLIGQTLFLILASALYREFWPAPFWRFIERAWDAISRPIQRGIEAIVAGVQTATEWAAGAFWDLYYLTPKGKREVGKDKAARAAVEAAFHQQLHPHCRCARSDS